MPSAELGQTLLRGDHAWRVVRLVRQSAIFENQEGVTEVVTEELLELKSETGQIDFEVLASDRQPYTGQPSPIKAPEPLNWRRD